MMPPSYKNVILTTHAWDRLDRRRLSIETIWRTIHQPDRDFPNQDDSRKFVKQISGRNVQVIAVYLKPEKKWLVISAWVRGEEDRLPLVWQLLTSPFRLGWWLLKKLFSWLFRG